MTVSITEISPNTRISFEILPTGSLGYEFKNVVFEGLISPSMAIALGVDIEADHVNRYASFKSGTPDDPRQYNYFQVTTSDGNRVTLGVPCIREGTLTVVSDRKCTLVWNSLSAKDQERLMTVLSANSLTPTSVTTE